MFPLFYLPTTTADVHIKLINIYKIVEATKIKYIPKIIATNSECAPDFNPMEKLFSAIKYKTIFN